MNVLLQHAEEILAPWRRSGEIAILIDRWGSVRVVIRGMVASFSAWRVWRAYVYKVERRAGCCSGRMDGVQRCLLEAGWVASRGVSAGYRPFPVVPAT